MKTLLSSLLAILALLFGQHAHADQEVEQRLEAQRDSIVEIEHLNGRAEIIGWDKEEVYVSGTLGEDTKEFIFERKGGTIKIEVKVENKGWGNWNSSSDGDDLVIKVPSASRIKYSSTNANLEISAIKGGVNADVINGKINANELSGRIELESVNGDINAKAITGDLRVQAVNGDIELAHDAGDEISVTAVNGDIEFTSPAKDVKVETVNGEIRVALVAVENLAMDTVNGSIKSQMNLLKGASVKASSVSGSIDLKFEPSVSATFDIEAHAGGSIRNKLSDDKAQKAEYGPSRWLEFSLGTPDATVNVTTVNGRVTLDKK